MYNNVMKQQNFPPLNPKVVLGIAAHPDDLDFSAAGTMHKWARNGAKVHYLILTDGSKGSEDTTITAEKLMKTRQKEQLAALRLLGGSSVDFLNYPDGQLEVTMKLKKDIVKAIRQFQPDIVVTLDPSLVYSLRHGFINHPDHRAAGQATLDAVFPLARDHMNFPEHIKAGYQPHKTSTLLMVNFDVSNYYSDVSDVIDQKLAIMAAHSSQGFTSQATKKRAKAIMTDLGKRAGCRYAEAFVRIDIS